MRKVRFLLAVVAVQAAAAVLTGRVTLAQCLEGCAPRPPLRLSPAMQDGPPLVWWGKRGRLGAPPSYGRPVLLGHVLPLDGLVGRRILPVAPLPKPLVYNAPDSFAGAVDPGLTLMPLLPPLRPAKRRGAYP